MEKIAYSGFFNSYIKMVKYYDDSIWYFKLCDEKGNTRGNTMLAKSNIKEFKWESIKNINANDYKLIEMSWSKMKSEFGNFIKFGFGVRYEVYENCDSYKVLKIKHNKVIDEKIFICIL